MNINQNQNITTGWVPIFTEIADKLLQYKDNRKPLIKEIHVIINKLEKEGIKIPFPLERLSDDLTDNLKDICPFSVFGIMNRKLTPDKRTAFLRRLAKFLQVSNGVDEFHFSAAGGNKDTDTIPLFSMNQRHLFFAFKNDREDDDIKKLWDMFEIAINYADGRSGTTREDFINAFDNIVPAQDKGGVKYTKTIKLSAGLYWIRPYNYPTFAGAKDSKTFNTYLDRAGFSKVNFDNVSGDDYLRITDGLKEDFNSSDTPSKDFTELSYATYHGDSEPLAVKSSKSKGNGENIIMTNQPLNQILYGPPGTGKTYETKALAVNVITGEDTKTIKRDKVNELYETLVQEGRIEFITFHQSYGYEEFVEGIKPTLSNGEESEDHSNEDVSYEIKDGIFKKLCTRAELASTPNFMDGYKPTDFDESTVWKIDLGRGGKYVEDCLKHNRIRLGFGDVKEVSKKTDKELLRESDSLYRFYRAMNPDNNDLVIVRSGSFHHIIAAGIIGEYKFDESLGEYCHTREVNWIWKKGKNEELIDVYDINNKKKFNRRHVVHRTLIKPYDLFQKVIPNKNKKVNKSNNKINGNNKQNYVLIIDEINRGNISKILGELITLVEKDKRLDNKEQLRITLPYSGERFGVPNNLYIIGTMNTADRSIAFLDTALRRRFVFNKKDPQPEILENVGGVNLSNMLSAMNNNICRELDKGHRIGHSYFMDVNSIEELAEVFIVNICPLLEEYFNEDGARISKVIGEQFLDMKDEEHHSWEWKEGSFSQVENYKKICELNNNSSS